MTIKLLLKNILNPPFFSFLFLLFFFTNLFLFNLSMTSPIKTSSTQPDSKRIEHVGDYIIQNKIGQGSFATVYKAQHKVNYY